MSRKHEVMFHARVCSIMLAFGRVRLAPLSFYAFTCSSAGPSVDLDPPKRLPRFTDDSSLFSQSSPERSSKGQTRPRGAMLPSVRDRCKRTQDATALQQLSLHIHPDRLPGRNRHHLVHPRPQFTPAFFLALVLMGLSVGLWTSITRSFGAASTRDNQRSGESQTMGWLRKAVRDYASRRFHHLWYPVTSSPAPAYPNSVSAQRRSAPLRHPGCQCQTSIARPSRGVPTA